MTHKPRIADEQIPVDRPKLEPPKSSANGEAMAAQLDDVRKERDALRVARDALRVARDAQAAQWKRLAARTVADIHKAESIIKEADEEIVSMLGRMEMLREEIDTRRAVIRAKRAEVECITGKQIVLGPLFLGDRMRSAANPHGMTFVEAVNKNVDGIAEVVAAMIQSG
jgi:hypothetical protein